MSRIRGIIGSSTNTGALYINFEKNYFSTLIYSYKGLKTNNIYVSKKAFEIVYIKLCHTSFATLFKKQEFN